MLWGSRWSKLRRQPGASSLVARATVCILLFMVTGFTISLSKSLSFGTQNKPTASEKSFSATGSSIQAPSSSQRVARDSSSALEQCTRAGCAAGQCSGLFLRTSGSKNAARTNRSSRNGAASNVGGLFHLTRLDCTGLEFKPRGGLTVPKEHACSEGSGLTTGLGLDLKWLLYGSRSCLSWEANSVRSSNPSWHLGSSFTILITLENLSWARPRSSALKSGMRRKWSSIDSRRSTVWCWAEENSLPRRAVLGGVRGKPKTSQFKLAITTCSSSCLAFRKRCLRRLRGLKRCAVQRHLGRGTGHRGLEASSTVQASTGTKLSRRMKCPSPVGALRNPLQACKIKSKLQNCSAELEVRSGRTQPLPVWGNPWARLLGLSTWPWARLLALSTWSLGEKLSNPSMVLSCACHLWTGCITLRWCRSNSVAEPDLCLCLFLSGVLAFWSSADRLLRLVCCSSQVCAQLERGSLNSPDLWGKQGWLRSKPGGTVCKTAAGWFAFSLTPEFGTGVLATPSTARLLESALGLWHTVLRRKASCWGSLATRRSGCWNLSSKLRKS